RVARARQPPGPPPPPPPPPLPDPRAPHDLREHGLVPAVNPVKRPDGCDRAPPRPTPRHASATTTRGFNASATRSATATSSPLENRATLPPSPFPAITGRPWITAARPASSSSCRGKSATTAPGSLTPP